MTEVTAATVGDPEAMRAFARELVSRADLLRAAHAQPAARLGAATFEGPASRRLRSSADDVGTRLAGICSDIEATAQALLADAGTVERENAALRAAAERAAADKANGVAEVANAAPAEPAGAATAPESAPAGAPPTEVPPA